MNIDFHYYGTYVAALLAGYEKNDAQIIAHAAQYVDDSNIDMVNASLTPDFIPVPTVQSPTELAKYNFYWHESQLDQTSRAWIPFHFLPGNYGDNTGKMEFTGIKHSSGKLFEWDYDDESENQFKLLCLPNSLLVSKIINDVIQNHVDKAYEHHLAGLRMHVLADTWAHKYYSGIPAWFINNAGESVYEITGLEERLVPWKRVKLEDFNISSDSEPATPDMPSYNSYVYLGHGRMGHLPDYPYIKYRYSPQWSSSNLTKDNSTDFVLAFKQMVTALKCIKNKTPFNVNVYQDLGLETETIIKNIISTRVRDQSNIWKQNLVKIKYNNKPLELPEEYSCSKWLDSAKAASDKTKTDYCHFNHSASIHLTLVLDSLQAEDIYIDKTPREHIYYVQIKNNVGFVGEMKEYCFPEDEYYPRVLDKGTSLSIIKPNNSILKSGDIVKIKTDEIETGEYCYLGAWRIKDLYYSKRDYDIERQKWQIVKIGGSGDNIIRKGDTIHIKNCHYKDTPYMCSYHITFCGDYLTTVSDTKAETAWAITYMSHFSRSEWKFNEKSGSVAYDALGYTNGILSATATRSVCQRQKYVGGAIHLDGSDGSFVTFGNGVGQFRFDAFTVAIWFNTSETCPLFDILGNRTAGGHGNFFSLRMNGTNGMICAEIDQDGSGKKYVAIFSSKKGLNDGQWHHVAIVRKGITLTLYVDGNIVGQEKSSSVGGINIANGNEFKLGRSLVGDRDKFAPNALYNDLRVYSNALSDKEISDIFAQ